MKSVYYCPSCNNLEEHDNIKGRFFCKKCGGLELSLNLTADRWNELSNEEMLYIIESAKRVTINKPQLARPLTSKREGTKSMRCVNCGAQIVFRADEDFVICEYCESTNTNPYISDAGNFGNIKLVFETVNKHVQKIVINVMETGDRFELLNGDSTDIPLKPGSYTFSFVFGDKKYYKKTIRVYSKETKVTISATCSKVRNLINVAYNDGIVLPENFFTYQIYKGEDYKKMLCQLGFVNVELDNDLSNPISDLLNNGNLSFGLFRKGYVTKVLVDGQDINQLRDGRMFSREAQVSLFCSR